MEAQDIQKNKKKKSLIDWDKHEKSCNEIFVYKILIAMRKKELEGLIVTTGIVEEILDDLLVKE